MTEINSPIAYILIQWGKAHITNFLVMLFVTKIRLNIEVIA